MIDPATSSLTAGGLILAIERSLAAYRGFRHARVERMTKDDVEEIVRDALSLHAERMENLVVDQLGKTRVELENQIWRARG